MAAPKYIYTEAAKDPVMEPATITSGAAANDFVMRDTSAGGVKLWAPASGKYICGLVEASDTAPSTFTKGTGAGVHTSLVGGVQADMRGQGVMGAKGPTGAYNTANQGHYTPIRVGDVYEIDLASESADYVPGIPLFLYPGTTGAQVGDNGAGNSEPSSGILLKLTKSNNGQVGRGWIKFTTVEGA